jgi:hypothetical protein
LTIDIIGTGITGGLYDWPDGSEKWSVGSAFQTLGARIDIYFCFHGEPVDVFNKSDIGYLDKHNYPLDDVVRKFGTRYFTNSIAYMIALAIMRKAKTIRLWGVDMEPGTEWAYERPCVAYWIGRAQERGIKVETSSELTEPFFMYGYDEEGHRLIKQLEIRRKHAEAMAHKTEGRESDQWVGKMVALRDSINLVRS